MRILNYFGNRELSASRINNVILVWEAIWFNNYYIDLSRNLPFQILVEEKSKAPLPPSPNASSQLFLARRAWMEWFELTNQRALSRKHLIALCLRSVKNFALVLLPIFRLLLSKTLILRWLIKRYWICKSVISSSFAADKWKIDEMRPFVGTIFLAEIFSCFSDATTKQRTEKIARQVAWQKNAWNL